MAQHTDQPLPRLPLFLAQRLAQVGHDDKMMRAAIAIEDRAAHLVAAVPVREEAIDHLARLYWYTVEFGLMRRGGDLRLYGAGIVSSFGESVFALDDASPNRIGFDLKRLMRTEYRIDEISAERRII